MQVDAAVGALILIFNVGITLAVRRATATAEAPAAPAVSPTAGAALAGPSLWRKWAGVTVAIPLGAAAYLWDQSGERPVVTTATTVAPAVADTATQGTELGATADIAPNGEALFRVTCPTCHGQDAKGVPGLGKDMTNSAFIKSQSDAELAEFIKVGRTADDPLNTTGVAMPAKGANVALTDEEILLIVEYMRSLSN